MSTHPTAADSQLGQPTDYAGHYDPRRLFPIPRAGNRAGLALQDVPLHGVDVWNAYELSWLDRRGKPAVALAELRVPASTPNLIESKSLKLYLNGFMQTRMDGAEAVAARMVDDLSAAAGGPVSVQLQPLSALRGAGLDELDGECIDDIDIDVTDYAHPQRAMLRVADPAPVSEQLVSHLLKSNCPVTGQPDWASVQIAYAGPRLDRAALLCYLIAYREHAEFHEHCVEQIFCDLWQQLQPLRLSVYARYTRRGGLDINPFRSSDPKQQPLNLRLPRQ